MQFEEKDTSKHQLLNASDNVVTDYENQTPQKGRQSSVSSIQVFIFVNPI